MSWKRLLIVSAVVLATPIRAEPSELAARTLFESCASDSQSAHYAACAEYMKEFVRRTRPSATEGNSRTICLPPDITDVEAAAVFVRMARSREDFLIGPADRAVRTALEVSFPCSKSR